MIYHWNIFLKNVTISHKPKEKKLSFSVFERLTLDRFDISWYIIAIYHEISSQYIMIYHRNISWYIIAVYHDILRWYIMISRRNISWYRIATYHDKVHMTNHNIYKEISDISWYINPRSRRDVSLTYHLYIIITIFNNLVLGGKTWKIWIYLFIFLVYLLKLRRENCFRISKLQSWSCENANLNINFKFLHFWKFKMSTSKSLY